ncbi:MAG TPA: hypothetical protein VF384_14805 [Planctomycetota bacterium]
MVAPARPRKRLLLRLAIAACSVVFAAILCEAVLRAAGGYRLLSLRLDRTARTGGDPAEVLDRAPDLVAPLVERWQRQSPHADPAWLRTSPPPLPLPPPLGQPLLPQTEWFAHYYVLNSVLLRSMWVKGQRQSAGGSLGTPDTFMVFDPPGGKPWPSYRYPPSCVLPTGLVTNAFGFRGRELTVDKPKHTVRIGFVGASTTVEAHGYGLRHSAPELIEHWLQLWAARRQLDVRFETLNAGREGIRSHDIRAIVADELMPLEIDYLVYYEGANQLGPVQMLKHVRVDGAYQAGSPPPGLVEAFDETQNADTTVIDRLASWSATARYLRSALRRDQRLVEVAKPKQELTLPRELLEGEFPLARAPEVLELGAISADLDAIHETLRAQDARLVLSTFWLLAGHGMTFDAVWSNNTQVHLNRQYWPLSYAAIRQLVDVQNRFFAAWAKARGVELVDVGTALPQDERLSIDATHQNELGVRLKAWLVFVQLLPILERDLAAGRVPVADRRADARHPNIGPPRELSRAELDR